MSKRIKELQERKGRLYTEMKSISELASTEKRDLTTDEDARWNKLDDEMNAVNKDIERENKLEANYTPTETEQRDEKKDAEKRAATFRKWAVYGEKSLSDADMKELRTTQSSQTTVTTAGGYTVPIGLDSQIYKTLLQYGAVRQAATVLTTADGALMYHPTMNDTSNSGELLAETTQATQQLITFGRVESQPFTFSSKIVPIQIELLQDSAFDMNTFIATTLGERVGRIENSYFTTGTGSSEPQGVVTAATASGVYFGASSVTRAYLLDVMHTVDPAYRLSPKCGWMFNDTTLKVIKKISLSDTYNLSPMWQVSTRDGEPDTLEGHPYWINQQMASPGAGNKSVLFGDFGRFLIRDVGGYTLVRMNERYADYMQVGFLLFHRSDSVLLTSGAIKYGIHGNT